jgi:hypothetical protein
MTILLAVAIVAALIAIGAYVHVANQHDLLELELRLARDESKVWADAYRDAICTEPERGKDS